MKIDYLPFELEILGIVMLGDGKIHRVSSIFDVYDRFVSIYRDGSEIKITLNEDMVIDGNIYLKIYYDITDTFDKSYIVSSCVDLNIEVDYITAVSFDSLPFKREPLFEKI